MPKLAGLYASEGRASIPPERLLRAALIQILFTLRSERQLMEQMQYNLLFRWFVGWHRRSRVGADCVHEEP
jgi:transposase